MAKSCKIGPCVLNNEPCDTHRRCGRKEGIYVGYPAICCHAGHHQDNGADKDQKNETCDQLLLWR